MSWKSPKEISGKATDATPTAEEEAACRGGCALTELDGDNPGSQ